MPTKPKPPSGPDQPDEPVKPAEPGQPAAPAPGAAPAPAPAGAQAPNAPPAPIAQPAPAAGATPAAQAAAATERAKELDRYKQEIRDAQLVLDFAITQSGAVRDEPLAVSETLIAAIMEAEGHLLLTELPPADARTKFEVAYRDLSHLVAPVTAQTLRDTLDEYGGRGWYWWYYFGKPKYSVAASWSQHLWFITGLVFLFVAFSETLDRTMIHMNLDEETALWLQRTALLSQVLNSLTRFGYGALGACVYLLRTLHVYTHRREFNRDRIPEYLNRILLGLVSGGTISLFVDSLTTDNGAVTLSEAALAFLAGYSSDFLFRAMERIVEAILPKVGIETVRKAAPVPVAAPVSLDDLLERLSRAETEEEKALLRSLIEKVRERM